MVFAKTAPILDHFVVKLGRMAEGWIKAKGGANALADTLVAKLPQALSKSIGAFETLQNAAAPFLWILDKIHRFLKGLGTLQGGSVAAIGQLLEGNFSGAGSILGSLPGDIARAAGVGDGTVDPAAETQRDEQIRLLREVVRNGATGALVFN